MISKEVEEKRNLPRRIVDRSAEVERHLQTVLVMLAAAILIWVGSTLVDLKGDTRVIGASLEVLQTQVKETLADRYTSKQAESDLKLRDFQIDASNKRIAELEKLANSIMPVLNEINKAISDKKGVR